MDALNLMFADFVAQGGKKDVIKIDSPIAVDLDVLGYLDPNCTATRAQAAKIIARVTVNFLFGEGSFILSPK